MRFFMTGTDTDVGKTVAAAWAVLQFGANYWKPIQCGTEDGTDSLTIETLTGCAPDNILPSAYVLSDPLSPHLAAKRAGVEIDLNALALPPQFGPLIVEGAGGLMVPLNDHSYILDLIESLSLPIILVCRTTLGTINHSLLSLAALRSRDISIAGVILNGPPNPDNRQAIVKFGKVPVIAEIPPLEPLNATSLRAIKPEIDLVGLTS